MPPAGGWYRTSSFVDTIKSAALLVGSPRHREYDAGASLLQITFSSALHDPIALDGLVRVFENALTSVTPITASMDFQQPSNVLGLPKALVSMI